MSYDAEDCEPYSVFVQKIVRARKEHACSACKARILPGELYNNIRTVFEGTAETVKRCGRCEVTYRHLERLGAEHGMVPDQKLGCGLKYEDEWDGPPPDEIAALVFLTSAEASALLAQEAPQP